jgi:hypothetical protein
MEPLRSLVDYILVVRLEGLQGRGSTGIGSGRCVKWRVLQVGMEVRGGQARGGGVQCKQQCMPTR